MTPGFENVLSLIIVIIIFNSKEIPFGGFSSFELDYLHVKVLIV